MRGLVFVSELIEAMNLDCCYNPINEIKCTIRYSPSKGRTDSHTKKDSRLFLVNFDLIQDLLIDKEVLMKLTPCDPYCCIYIKYNSIQLKKIESEQL